MKIIGILSFTVGVYLFVHERLINENKTKANDGDALKYVALSSQIGMILIGLMLIFFSPWGCE
jgi:hypothetical protein